MTSLAQGGRRPWFLLLIAGTVLGIGLLIFGLYAPSSSAADTARASALRYARAEMAWSQGPDVQSVQVLPLGHLPRALRRSVPVSVQRDVNVSDLLRQYGSRRSVAMVVLQGAFNSLPPDEGVVVRGDVVVLVDMRTNRVLFLMA